MKRTIHLIALIALLAASLASNVAAEEINLASWNVKRLGHQPAKDLAVLTRVMADYDILALQEVMNESLLPEIEQRLERLTAADWEIMCSHAIGRGSYKEAYCFTWRTDRIDYDQGANVFLDPEDVFAREPYSAVFATKNGFSFHLATVHVLYGKRRSDRVPEARALADYWGYLADIAPDIPVVLAGDFNLRPSDDAFQRLRRVARPQITSGATTLSSIDGRYANLYDQIWTSPTLTVVASGIRNFPAEFGLTHEEARRSVSDHAPVWLRFRVGEAGE